MRGILLCAAMLLMLAGCGDSEEASDEPEPAPPTTEAAASDSTTTVTSTTVAESSTSGGAYSVIVASGVDSLTANGQLEDLQAAGFEGFVVDGSDDTGYTVHHPGLAESEAEELLQQVRDAIFGGSNLPGLIGETEEWVPSG